MVTRITDRSRRLNVERRRIEATLQQAVQAELTLLWRRLRSSFRRLDQQRPKQARVTKSQLHKANLAGAGMWESFQARLETRLLNELNAGAMTLNQIHNAHFKTQVGGGFEPIEFTTAELTAMHQRRTGELIVDRLQEKNSDLTTRCLHITRELRAQVGVAVNDWYNRPETTLQDLVDELHPTFSEVRAQRIAITEVTFLNSRVTRSRMDRLGITEWTWDTHRDEIVCRGCRSLHGRKFHRDDAMPPLHPNCRCSPIEDLASAPGIAQKKPKPPDSEKLKAILPQGFNSGTYASLKGKAMKKPLSPEEIERLKAFALLDKGKIQDWINQADKGELIPKPSKKAKEAALAPAPEAAPLEAVSDQTSLPATPEPFKIKDQQQADQLFTTHPDAHDLSPEEIDALADWYYQKGDFGTVATLSQLQIDNQAGYQKIKPLLGLIGQTSVQDDHYPLTGEQYQALADYWHFNGEDQAAEEAEYLKGKLEEFEQVRYMNTRKLARDKNGYIPAPDLDFCERYAAAHLGNPPAWLLEARTRTDAGIALGVLDPEGFPIEPPDWMNLGHYAALKGKAKNGLLNQEQLANAEKYSLANFGHGQDWIEQQKAGKLWVSTKKKKGVSEPLLNPISEPEPPSTLADFVDLEDLENIDLSALVEQAPAGPSLPATPPAPNVNAASLELTPEVYGLPGNWYQIPPQKLASAGLGQAAIDFLFENPQALADLPEPVVDAWLDYSPQVKESWDDWMSTQAGAGAAPHAGPLSAEEFGLPPDWFEMTPDYLQGDDWALDQFKQFFLQDPSALNQLELPQFDAWTADPEIAEAFHRWNTKQPGYKGPALAPPAPAAPAYDLTMDFSSQGAKSQALVMMAHHGTGEMLTPEQAQWLLDYAGASGDLSASKGWVYRAAAGTPDTPPPSSMTAEQHKALAEAIKAANGDLSGFTIEQLQEALIYVANEKPQKLKTWMKLVQYKLDEINGDLGPSGINGIQYAMMIQKWESGDPSITSDKLKTALIYGQGHGEKDLDVLEDYIKGQEEKEAKQKAAGWDKNWDFMSHSPYAMNAAEFEGAKQYFLAHPEKLDALPGNNKSDWMNFTAIKDKYAESQAPAPAGPADELAAGIDLLGEYGLNIQDLEDFPSSVSALQHKAMKSYFLDHPGDLDKLPSAVKAEWAGDQQVWSAYQASQAPAGSAPAPKPATPVVTDQTFEAFKKQPKSFWLQTPAAEDSLIAYLKQNPAKINETTDPPFWYDKVFPGTAAPSSQPPGLFAGIPEDLKNIIETVDPASLVGTDYDDAIKYLANHAEELNTLPNKDAWINLDFSIATNYYDWKSQKAGGITYSQLGQLMQLHHNGIALTPEQIAQAKAYWQIKSGKDTATWIEDNIKKFGTQINTGPKPGAPGTLLDHKLLQQVDLHDVEPTWQTSSQNVRYGGVVFDESGKVMLRMPTRKPNGDYYDGYAWTFAKGGKEPGITSPIDVAVKECGEEYGHLVQAIGLVPGLHSSGNSTNAYFIMKSTAYDPSLMDKETEEIRWVDYEEAKKLIRMGTNTQGVKRDLGVLEAAYKENARIQDGKADYSHLFVAPPPPPAPIKRPPKPPARIEPPVDLYAQKPTFPAAIHTLTDLGGAGGTTGSRLVQDPETGKKFIQKRNTREPEQARMEAAANHIYQAAGIRTPTTQLYKGAGGAEDTMLTEFIPETQKLSEFLANPKTTKAQKKKVEEQLHKGFAADVLLMNWDVLGADGDNVRVDPDGTVWRVDNGGSFDIAAMGGKKKDPHTEYPLELWSMRGKHYPEYGDAKPPTGGAASWSKKIYSSMTMNQIGSSCREIAARRPEILAATPPEHRETIARKLDHLEHLGNVQQQAEKTRLNDAYQDEMLRILVNHHQAGISDAVPREMNAKRTGPVNNRVRTDYDVALTDENGEAWDKMRTKGKEISLTTRIAKEIAAKGGDFALISEWTRKQGGSSWSGISHAVKYWFARETGSENRTFWHKGIAAAEADYNEQVARWDQDDGQGNVLHPGRFDRTLKMFHAATVDYLNRMDLHNKNEDGTLTLYRTDGNDVYAIFGSPQVGDHLTGKIRGSLDSTSLVNPIRAVSGEKVFKQRLPITNVMATYLLEGTPGRGDTPFYRDGENEVVAHLADGEFDYVATEPEKCFD